MDIDHWVGRQSAVYKRMLVLYPASFRRQFGASMVADFTDRLRAEYQRKPSGATRRVWARTLHDLFISAPDQRWEHLMARTTAVTAVYSIAAYAALSAISRTLTFTWLALAVLAVAGVRWSANAPDPQTSRDRLQTVAWVTLGVAAASAPLLWWSGMPAALAVAGVGLLVFSRRAQQPATR